VRLLSYFICITAPNVIYLQKTFSHSTRHTKTSNSNIILSVNSLLTSCHTLFFLYHYICLSLCLLNCKVTNYIIFIISKYLINCQYFKHNPSSIFHISYLFIKKKKIYIYSSLKNSLLFAGTRTYCKYFKLLIVLNQNL